MKNTYADSIRQNISCILMHSNKSPIPQDQCTVHNHRKNVLNKLNGIFVPRQAKESLCKLWKSFHWHSMVLQPLERCSSLDQSFCGNLERNCVLADIQWHKWPPGYLKKVKKTVAHRQQLEIICNVKFIPSPELGISKALIVRIP